MWIDMERDMPVMIGKLQGTVSPPLVCKGNDHLVYKATCKKNQLLTGYFRL